ncbi:MAG: NAD-dependent epimerase/dehydratase family protein, partial [Pseudomonadales bacterium]
MRENKNRVLVTGASGFVGRHALRALAELGYEVHAVSRAPEEQHRTCGRWHCGNLLVAEDRERILRETRPTHLLHLAWETDHGKFWASPKNLDWLVATVELLHCFAVLGGARFVGAGTCFEYDSEAAAAGARLCLESETALGTKTLYDCTKSATFHVAAEFCRLN